jgi:8-oxo-dGTP pyrophosphatase MutT (NUDIX family)
MYKIYINDSELILCKSSKKEKIAAQVHPHLVVPYQGRKKMLLNYVDTLEKSPTRKAIIIHDEEYKSLKYDFTSLIPEIVAAGGMVKNQHDEILFIFRRESWDLPKGKLDKGETNSEAALREVMEETGIKNVSIIGKIGKTQHLFRTRSNRRAIKKSHWYLMSANKQALTPQEDEDIEVAVWMTKERFLSRPRIVYRSILDVINRAVKNEKPEI